MMNKPIFHSVFSNAWQSLPRVFQSHYAHRLGTDDLVIVAGRMDVSCSPALQRWGWLLALMKSIPPFEQQDVPVTVAIRSHPSSKGLHFYRTFHFNGRKPYHFHSCLTPIDDNQVFEETGANIGWCTRISFDGKKIIMRHDGYAIRLLARYFKIPLQNLLGEGYAEESVVNDDTFDVAMRMSHPKWGKWYEYKGRFKILFPPSDS